MASHVTGDETPLVPVVVDDIPLVTVVTNGVPVGTIVAYAAEPEHLPAGWFVCDHRKLEAAKYPELREALGLPAGGIGGEIQLPDLRGQFLRSELLACVQIALTTH